MGHPYSAPESTLGPIFISLIFHVVLVGMVMGQTFVYLNSPSKAARDKVWLRIMVVVLLFANFLNCGFNVAYLYGVLVTRFADPSAFARANWVFSTNPALTAIIGFIVQAFFVWRVLVLTHGERGLRRYLSVAIITLCALGQLFGGVSTAVCVHMKPTFDEFGQFEGVIILWLGSSTLGMLSIVGVLFGHLVKNRSEFLGFGPVADRITNAFVQTGLVLGACALAQLVVYLTAPTGHRLTLSLPLPQLYTATLLSTLNAREGWGWPASARARSGSSGSGAGTAGTRGLGFAPNPALELGSRATRGARETIVLHPIEYEAHEMGAVGKEPVVLERVPELDAQAAWDAQHEGEEVKYVF